MEQTKSSKRSQGVLQSGVGATPNLKRNSQAHAEKGKAIKQKDKNQNGSIHLSQISLSPTPV
jgi:hypothetical protein